MFQNNSNPEKQVILLMISNEEGWCFLAVKKLLALLRGITSKRHGDFFVWIAFIFLQQKTHVDRVKKVCENKDFCKVIMPSEDIIIEKMFNRKDWWM